MKLTLVEELYKLVGANILLIAYRGYSHSQGTASEPGIKIDGETMPEYALSRSDVIDTNQLYLLGRDLGAALAVYLASKPDTKIRGTLSVKI